MSEFRNIAFPKTGLFVKRLFGWRVASAIYAVWACVRCSYESTVKNHYWSSAFWFKPFDESDPTKTTPFYSYPATAYFKRVDWSAKRILEFGGGYSTTWWKERAKSVFTADTDPEWVEYAETNGIQAIHATLDEMALLAAGYQDFDVVIVDNSYDRSAILKALIDRDLTGKIVILDNAEFHDENAERLTKKCVHWASFEGMAPGQTRDVTTIWWF